MLNKYTDDAYVGILRDMYPGNDVEIVASIDNGGSYEWDVAVVYRVYGVNNYYMGTGSGCSCDWYTDNAAYGDLMQFSSRRALLNYLRNSNVSKVKSLHGTVLAQR